LAAYTASGLNSEYARIESQQGIGYRDWSFVWFSQFLQANAVK
jgi:hypothetical protein